MRRLLVMLLLASAPVSALAEGRCPPGQYPVGDQNAEGCAPIPGAGQPAASRPTGKWETRWGAIVEDERPDPNRPLATGVAVSQKSKRAAVSMATEQCRAKGGSKCELRIAYYNQCVALADPELVNGRIPVGLTSTAARAETLEQARVLALDSCRSGGKGSECEITYSACSTSEFRKF